jgi:hypothetical protein
MDRACEHGVVSEDSFMSRRRGLLILLVAVVAIVALGLVFAVRGDPVSAVLAASALVTVFVAVFRGPDWQPPRSTYLIPAGMLAIGIATVCLAHRNSLAEGYGLALACTSPVTAFQVMFRRRNMQAPGD